MKYTGVFLTGPKKGEWYSNLHRDCLLLKEPEKALDKAERIEFQYVEWYAGNKQYGFWVESRVVMNNSVDINIYIMNKLIEGLKK